MKKLVKGILEFRQKVRPHYSEKFARLALGQFPDTLLIACSDSRVAPNVFASTDPGDMFVVRNVGNLIPCCGTEGHSTADESEAAAIEFAIMNLNVADIIVCGHSDCGAMQALIDGREKVAAPHLRAWLRHGDDALARVPNTTHELDRMNVLSQQNVLQQLEHLKTYPLVRDRLAAGQLNLHGWWFELSTANVFAYEEGLQKFLIIDEEQADRILERLEGTGSSDPNFISIRPRNTVR